MRFSSRAVPFVCIALLLVLHGVWFARLFSGFAVDDAYISFRYAANLAHGRGLVFNAGEHVEGYSNFLWVLMMTPACAGNGDPTRWSQILGLLFSVAALGIAMDSLPRVFGVVRPGARLALGAGIATCAYFAAWSAGGMESGLYAALLIAFWARSAIEMGGDSRRWPLSALLCGALALSRPEGLLVAAAGAALHAWRALRTADPARRRQSWWFVGVVLGIVVPYHAWRFAYYGPHLFPNSVHAKVGGTLAQAGRGALYVLRNFALPCLPLLAAAAAPRRLRRQPAFWTGQLLVWGHLAVVAAAGGDWSAGRYFAPLVPLACTLLAAAVADAWASPRLVAARGARYASAAVLAAWAAGAWYWTGWRHEAVLRRDFATTDRERIAIGRWLAEKMPPQTRIAVYAAGQLAFYSRLYTHDMLGLNDAHIARVAVPEMGRGFPGHERSDANYTLDVVRPDLIIDGHRIPGMRRHPTYAGQYARIPNWKICEVAIRRDVFAAIVRERGAAFLAGGGTPP